MSSSGRFVWHDLVTSDVEGAKAFYGALLGWSYVPFTGPDGEPVPGDMPEYPMIEAAGAAMAQGGIMAAQQPGVPPHWIGHVALPGADDVAARAAGAGGTVLFGPFDIPLVGRNVLLADPQGAAFGVIAFAGEGMPAPEGALPAGSFVWDELIVDDVEAAKAFYAATTGWGAQAWPGGELPYTLFTVGEQQAAGLMERPADMPMPPCWLAYVTVDDLAATAARVAELGGTVHAPPFSVPGVGEIAVIGDPQGAVLGLIQPDMSGGGAGA